MVDLYHGTVTSVAQTRAEVWDVAQANATRRGEVYMPVLESLPGAASASLHDVLSGPPLAAEVLASFSRAIYLRLPAAHSGTCPALGERVVAIITPDALRLPCSIVVGTGVDLDGATSGALTPRDARSAATPGEAGGGVIGAGAVHLPHLSVRVTRWWRPRRPRPLRATPALAENVDRLAALLPPLPEELTGPAVALQTRLASWPADPEAAGCVAEEARQLVGLGPGLTPAGDDLLAALMLALTAAPGAARALAAALAASFAGDAAEKTTSLSRALLRHGASGEGVPEIADLVDILATAPESARSLGGARGVPSSAAGPLQTTLARVLAIGSSSGGALAHGVLLGARVTAALAGRSHLTPSEVA